MPKFIVRIEQDIPEVAFQTVEAKDAAGAILIAYNDPDGPYATGEGFEDDLDAGITQRAVVSAEPLVVRGQRA